MQDAAGRLALIRHGGIDEHFVEREAFGDALGQFDIGENAARDRQIARPLAGKNFVKRGERHLFEDLLGRGRDILAPRACGQPLEIGDDLLELDIGANLTVVQHAVVTPEFFAMDRLAKRGEAQHLALVAIGTKPEAGGRGVVEEAQAVGLVLRTPQFAPNRPRRQTGRRAVRL